MNIVGEMIDKANNFLALAEQVQSDTLSLTDSDRKDKLSELSVLYRSWYHRALGLFTSLNRPELQEAFIKEYEGDWTSHKIQKFLSLGWKPHAIAKWVAPFERSFKDPLQKQCDLLAILNASPVTPEYVQMVISERQSVESEVARARQAGFIPAELKAKLQVLRERENEAREALYWQTVGKVEQYEQSSRSKGNSVGDTISILFMAADPTDATRLRLGEELREIQEKLQLAKLREKFTVHQRMSVRPADISQVLLDVQPKIVHFSGHGTTTGALCFENQVGETHLIEPSALAALFEQFADHVDCVILNACYSENQANAIATHIDYVIGMRQTIGDRAAIAFTIGFYQALGAGRTIEEAYKLGCVQIKLQGISEHLVPVLIKKGQLQT